MSCPTKYQSSIKSKFKNYVTVQVALPIVLIILSALHKIPKQKSQANASQGQNAALIHIIDTKHHPATVATIHESSPSPSAATNSAANGELLSSASTGFQAGDELALKAASFEMRSPMKKILDLINGHSQPIIVVSSSDGGSAAPLDTSSNSNQNIEQDANSNNQQQMQQPTLVTSPNTIHFAGQQWALVPADQLGLQQRIQQQQSQNHQQQQQMPQYNFVNPHSLMDAQNRPQMAIVPATISFGSLASSSYPQAGGQLQGFEAGYQNVANAEADVDRTQPVFLSSYVPESPSYPNIPQQQQQQQQPDSIKQVQNSQKQQTAPEESAKQQPQEQDGSANDNENNEINEPEVNQPNGPMEDIEEPKSSRHVDSSINTANNNNDAPQPSSSQDPDNSSGSLIYEDKYDSDKDADPSAGSSNRAINTKPGVSAAGSQADSSTDDNNVDKKADANNGLQNGLVNVGLNDDCLQCICRAASGCDEQLRCITRGSEDKFCGPFQLTEEYWNMAGTPGDPSSSGFTSFEDCANDSECAVETVTNYMKKYHKDCDGDENITCMDYARLHRLKPNECGDTDRLANDFDAYWAKFQRCAEGYNRSRNGDDEDI